MKKMMKIESNKTYMDETKKKKISKQFNTFTVFHWNSFSYDIINTRLHTNVYCHWKAFFFLQKTTLDFV